MEKMTKFEMLDQVIEARNKEMALGSYHIVWSITTVRAYEYVECKSYDYVKRVYDKFLKDKEHVMEYYALLVR